MTQSTQQLIKNRYHLHNQIGEGGMGTVYRGVDGVTGNPVAIKLLKSQAIANDASIVERFNREADALRRLNHPNIVKVLDTVQEGDQHYIVMEYAGERTLRDVLHSGDTLAVVRVLELALDLADALTRAHRLQIIHRDIKPANVMIGDDGTPRLTDFGVAFMANQERVTENTSAVGTLDYMSPEALNMDVVDGRADLWSFGVVLFEMLSGERPFRGKSFSKIITAIMTHTPPDLEQLCPDLPIALVDLIYRMLEKDRDLRIPSVRLVGAEIENILLNWDTTSVHLIPPRTLESQRFTRPTMSTNDIPKDNLPVQVTEFVGRQRELDDLEKLMIDPNRRLLTIVGPGGMGKTRLALEAADRHIGDYQHGVYFVPLAPLSEAESIIATVAGSIGFTPIQVDTSGEVDAKNKHDTTEQHRSEWQQLLDYFKDKQMLLIFDNFEHVLDGGSLASEILKQAPRIQIITTSRERLNLQEETVFRIEGMEFPEDDAVDFDADYSAIRLFAQSARRARPDFSLEGDDLRAVVEICRMVQGMPLGILLAAAWVEMLSLEEIVEEMRQNFDFLETDIRNMPERHRSLRAIFDYSWQMLSAEEKQVFARLSIFRGGCDRRAAQKIIGASLRTLTGLVSKSLLRRDPDSGRYELHELLRQYAAECLEKLGEGDDMRHAHSQHYARTMYRYEAGLQGGRQVEALDEIEADLDNIRNGFKWAVKHLDYQSVIDYATSLDLFYTLRSHHEEMIDMFEWAVKGFKRKADNTSIAVKALGRVMARRSRAIWRVDDVAPIRADLEYALKIAEENDDIAEVIFCLQLMGHVLLYEERDLDDVWKLAQKRVEISKQSDNKNGEADAYFQMGYLAARKDMMEELYTYTQRSYEIYEEIGDRYSMGRALHNIGAYHEMKGNIALAEEIYQQVLDLQLEIRNLPAAVKSLNILAWTAHHRGDFSAANNYITDTEIIAHQRNMHMSLAEVNKIRSSIAFANEKYEDALRFAETAMSYGHSSKHKDEQQMSKFFSAMAYLGLGKIELARDHMFAYLKIILKKVQPGQHGNGVRHKLAQVTKPIAMVLAEDGNLERSAYLTAFTMRDNEAPVWMEKHPLIARYNAHICVTLPADVYAEATTAGENASFDEVLVYLNELMTAYDRQKSGISSGMPSPFDGTSSDVIAIPVPVQSANQSLIEPLSERELEVLNLITQGYSNREIAEQLVIGLSTVKKHINHIYGKLEVTSRTRAIVRAGELNLV